MSSESGSQSAAHSSHYSTITSQLSFSSPPPPPTLTSLLHQKLTTNAPTNHQQLQHIHHMHHQPKPVAPATADKQVILNDIASGLASAVAIAVSEAVSSVQQQINNQEMNQRRAEPASPPRQHFSHLRQQLEAKEPALHHTSSSGSNSTILRKRLSNINIEAAVATAVNRYLTTTMKNNQKLTRNQLDHDENVILVDGKCLLKN